MCGFITQLVEHRTGIAEVTGSNPVEALIFFFRLLLSNCLNWKFTAMITLHSHLQPQYKYELFHIYFSIRNPVTKRFNWRQKNPLIQRRLDYWLISDVCQEDIEKPDIISSINSDHSAIVLHFNNIDRQKHGPSFWKFNASLAEDANYVKLLNESMLTWLDDHMLTWLDTALMMNNMFEICHVTYNVYGLLYIWSDERLSRRSTEVIPSPRGLGANAW